MKLSEIHPAQDLRDFLKNAGYSFPVFAYDDIPSADLPQEYLQIAQNGTAGRVNTTGEIYDVNLMISINVKLSPTGVTRFAKQQIMLEELESIGKNPDMLTFLQLDTIYEGKTFTSGYSTKVINILTRIIKSKF